MHAGHAQDQSLQHADHGSLAAGEAHTANRFGLGLACVSTDSMTWIALCVADAFHHAVVSVLANRRGANSSDLENALRFLGRGAGRFRLLGENLADLSVRIHRVSNIASDAGSKSTLTSQTRRR
jgi:hypothetical protein